MTDDRSLERAARSWLELGPTEAPDHAVEAALLRIETTAQERDWRVQLPRRTHPMTIPARLMAAAIALAVVTVGGILILRPGGSPIAATSSPSPSAARTPALSIGPGPGPSVLSSAGALDYSALPGRILMEHAGNAPDGSEPANGDYHIDRRRFYWMDPKTMTGTTAVEFLSGQPPAGKVLGDISPDQTKVVFQDPGDGTGEYIWTAKLDGSGFAKISTACNAARAACGDWDPSFDPTGTKVVFVRAQADTTILEIKDLVTGKETRLLSTEGSSSNDVAEKPDWSPDGTKIAFGRMHWRSEGNPQAGSIWIVDIAADRTTKVEIPGITYPGNPHWSPDGSRLLFMDGPLSMAAVPMDDPLRTSDVYTIAADGTDLRRLTHMNQVVTADYTPDGEHIFFFNNYYWMMNLDGTDPRPVNARGDDLSEMNVGFGYVGHWITKP